MEQMEAEKTAFLKGLSANTEDLVFPLQDEVVRIGRKEGIELTLHGNGISRIHAQIKRHPDGWELIDLKSTNGTYVNRKMISTKILANSDFIQIGDVELLFELSDEHADRRAGVLPEDQSIYLIGLTDSLDGKTFPLEKETISLGRLPDNDIVINTKSVSGYHAEIKIDHGRYFLIDLNSTNGTFVNARKIEQEEIHAGDIIRLNNYNFKVCCGDYKFANTGTLINYRIDDVPDEADDALRELKEHPSYVNLKTTGLFHAKDLAEPETEKEAEEAAPATTSRITTTQIESRDQNKVTIFLLAVIAFLLLVIAFLLMYGSPTKTSALETDPETIMGSLGEEDAARYQLAATEVQEAPLPGRAHS